MSRKSGIPLFDKSDPWKEYPPELVKPLMECRAAINDKETNNQLLKELVLSYANAEVALAALNRELAEKQRRLEEDLKAAESIQRSLIPKDDILLDGLKMYGRSLPSDLIGGDVFNLVRLDEDHFACYAMDVSGHGVSAAMVTVMVAQAIFSNSGQLIKRTIPVHPFYEIVPPSEVLGALHSGYPFERFNKYFTMVYLVINARTGTVQSSNAAHPSPVVLMGRDRIKTLDAGGGIIGTDTFFPCEQETLSLGKGDKILIYTDGVTDYQRSDGQAYGSGRLHHFLETLRARPMPEILERLQQELLVFAQGEKHQDDITLVGLEFG